MTAPLTLAGFPRAILHVDGDAFFAAVEQALDPHLRGRPVVTGAERGIIAAASYEARALGIRRGITLGEARRLCPALVIRPSDYESYSLYSQRMFNLMRHYTPTVEEYSIDEGFADITGMRRVFRCSYPEIARQLQARIASELGITVSVGLSLTKTLAKLCSKFRKPRGFTAVEGRHIHLLLQRTPLDKVWGFGPNTVALLEKQGLRTAYDFVTRPRAWADHLLHKPGRDGWDELRGQPVLAVDPAPARPAFSLMKGKTFIPPSADADYVYARLIANIEAAFTKARRHHVRPRRLGIVLRRADFQHDGIEARLSRAPATAAEAMPIVRTLFDRVHAHGVCYRATLVVLAGLENDGIEPLDLFEDRVRIDALQRATAAVDRLNQRYGKRTVRAGTALFMDTAGPDRRAADPARRQLRMPGESAQRRLAIPRLDIKV